MFDVDVKLVLRDIERKMRFLPEYFYCQHPADSAPIRILVSGLRYWQRGRLLSSLRNRGFVVQYWQAKFKGFN